MNKLEYINYVREKSTGGIVYPELFKELDPQLFERFSFLEPVPVRTRNCGSTFDSKYLILDSKDLFQLDFTSAYLAKQKLSEYNIRISEEGDEVTYTGLDTFVRPYDSKGIARQFTKQLPELIALYDRTRVGVYRGLSIDQRNDRRRQRLKFAFTDYDCGFIINNRAIVTVSVSQGKIIIDIKPRVRNDHVMREVSSLIIATMKLTKLGLVDNTYIGLTQESRLVYELSADTFPSISFATSVLREKINAVDVKIEELMKERQAFQDALNGLDKFKKLYKQGVLDEI